MAGDNSAFTLSSQIARLKMIDLTTGLLTRDGVAFLSSIFFRLGGTNAPSVPDIEVTFPEDAGVSETQQLLFNLQQGLDQAPLPPVQSFQEFLNQVNELTQAPPGFVPATMYEDVLGELRQVRDLCAEMQKQIDGINQRVEL